MTAIISALRYLDTNDLLKLIKYTLIEMEHQSDNGMLQLKKPRSKSKAKENEAADVKTIVDALNNTHTVQGIKLLNAFKQEFGIDIECARQTQGAGGHSNHYDFEIKVGGLWYKVEHKGTITYKEIDVNDVPWECGVQFHNGHIDKYTIGHRYARLWYDRYIASGSISRKYGIISPIPDYKTWFIKDAKCQKDPSTPFGLELRSKFRGDGKTGGCRDERDEMTQDFKLSESDIELFKEEILSIAQNSLKEKEYWLQINGDINGEFYCKWSRQLSITTITDVTQIKSKDIQFEFSTDMGFPIKAKLRWGKGQGLSNLRIDLA